MRSHPPHRFECGHAREDGHAAEDGTRAAHTGATAHLHGLGAGAVMASVMASTALVNLTGNRDSGLHTRCAGHSVVGGLVPR